MKKCSIFRM